MLILRQVALVVKDISAAERLLVDLFGITVCYRDPQLAQFGLENILAPMGNQFLEVVSPVAANTTAGRFLEKHGDGGYMLITQCDDQSPYRRRVSALGVRIVHEFNTEQFLNMQLHPKDTGGSFLEIDQQLDHKKGELSGPWAPAGGLVSSKFKNKNILGINTVGMNLKNARDVADKWAKILNRERYDDSVGFCLHLDNARIRYSEKTAMGYDGLGVVEIDVRDERKITSAAENLGIDVSNGRIVALGVEWHFSRNETYPK